MGSPARFPLLSVVYLVLGLLFAARGVEHLASGDLTLQPVLQTAAGGYLLYRAVTMWRRYRNPDAITTFSAPPLVKPVDPAIGEKRP